ncbi:MAG: hypothetical protein K0V04_07700 [Deltaproteobacteria bacterium]|nr:hypothetical protein [Deltaproteobacteria bacterium]
MGTVLSSSLGIAVILVGIAALALCVGSLVRAVADARHDGRALELQRVRAEQCRTRSGWSDRLGEIAGVVAPLLGVWLGLKLSQDDEEPPDLFGFPRGPIPTPPPSHCCAPPHDTTDEPGTSSDPS